MVDNLMKKNYSMFKNNHNIKLEELVKDAVHIDRDSACSINQ